MTHWFKNLILAGKRPVRLKLPLTQSNICTRSAGFSLSRSGIHTTSGVFIAVRKLCHNGFHGAWPLFSAYMLASATLSPYDTMFDLWMPIECVVCCEPSFPRRFTSHM